MATGTRSDFAGVQDSRDTSYNLNQHTYPINLFDEQYGGNYVIFYINTSEDSKLIPKDSSAVRDAPSNRRRSDLVGRNISGAQAAGVSGAGGILAGVGLGGVANIGSAPGNAVVGGALSAGASLAISGGASLTQPQKRLNTAIALHIPNQLTSRYGVQYEEDNMAGFQMLSKGADVITSALSGNFTGSGGAIQSIAANLAISAGLPGAAGTARGMGVAPNPKKEQVFKGVDFRTFQFQYQFFPRNEKEAENVLEIIQAFKFHMHPEYKDNDGFLFIYPSEFDIVYYSGNSVNNKLHKHTSCVLRDMSVNYTPQGQFNSFQGGMPSQINLDMTFLELAILTKEDIAEGF